MATGVVEMGRPKCERYWPTEAAGKATYGRFTVAVEQATDCGEYIVTDLILTHHNEKRLVTHYWYTGWPDHEAPASAVSVLDLLHRVRARTPPGTPIVVHCSAGIGRTGTFMAIDMGMDELDQPWRCVARGRSRPIVHSACIYLFWLQHPAHPGPRHPSVTDVLGNLTRIRSCRGGSIQTPVQYRFVHRALQEYVTHGTPQSIFGTNTPREITITKVRVRSVCVCGWVVDSEASYFLGFTQLPNQSWGFTLRGSSPPFLVIVDSYGLAEMAGAVVGDHVLSINGVETLALSHKQCVELLAKPNKVTLVLLAKRGVPSRDAGDV